MNIYKILVVDDDSEIRNAVINLLNNENYITVGAASIVVQLSRQKSKIFIMN